jgi:hypothetical protein
MDRISHTVTLDFNITGYSGSDLDAVVPHFMTERETNLALTWRPSTEGPESFRLIIDIAAGYAAGSFLKTFVQELSKDLYKWGKERLSPLFEKKDQALGNVSVEFEDITVNYYSGGGDDLNAFFQELPELLETADPEQSAIWHVSFDRSEEKWEIAPGKKE